jgi:hypothetical protein
MRRRTGSLALLPTPEVVDVAEVVVERRIVLLGVPGRPAGGICRNERVIRPPAARIPATVAERVGPSAEAVEALKVPLRLSHRA